MGVGGKDAGEVPPTEDMEQFLELRRHVKKMQAGTPLLVRSVGDGGQDELQICTFSVSQDLQTLRWTDQEGSGATREVPMSSVVDVSEDSPPVAASQTGEDAHHGLTLTLRQGDRKASREMNLICASPEDLVAWREGLRFLIVAQPGPVSAPPTAAPPAAARPAAKASSTPASIGSSAQGGSGDLVWQLAKEREANEKLRQENEALREQLKRKDATIGELLRDAQSQAVKDRPIKTESTSRESDIHLHDREVAILQRKNQRLRKALKAKQQTVSELLKLVGKVTAQQGAESSAVEEVDEEDDEDEVDSADMASSTRGGAAAAVRKSPMAAAATAAASRGAGKTATLVTGGDDSEDEEEEDDDSEPSQAVKEEMRKLAGQQRQQQRRDFAPPPRGAPVPPKAAGGSVGSSRSSQGRPAQSPGPSGLAELLSAGLLGESSGGDGVPAGGAAQLLQALLEGAAAASASAAAGGTTAATQVAPAAPAAPVAAPAAAATAPAARGAAGATAGGAARGGQGSGAALQALERELEMLEEKKRVVERLARQLEPPSDNEEEDDGFPLR